MMKSFSDFIYVIFMYFSLQIREWRINDEPTIEIDKISYEDANLVVRVISVDMIIII